MVSLQAVDLGDGHSRNSVDDQPAENPRYKVNIGEVAELGAQIDGVLRQNRRGSHERCDQKAADGVDDAS